MKAASHGQPTIVSQTNTVENRPHDLPYPKGERDVHLDPKIIYSARSVTFLHKLGLEWDRKNVERQFSGISKGAGRYCLMGNKAQDKRQVTINSSHADPGKRRHDATFHDAYDLHLRYRLLRSHRMTVNQTERWPNVWNGSSAARASFYQISGPLPWCLSSWIASTPFQTADLNHQPCL